MKTNILIDGKFFAYRTITTQFHLTHEETKTGMFYGFLNAVKSIAKKYEPDNVIIMWDSNYSFRKAIYPEYKSKRNKPLQENENLVLQLETIRDEYENLMMWMHKIGFASYIKRGLEADDLFYYFVNQWPNDYNIIATKDEDLFQLLKKNRVVIYDPKDKVMRTEQWFIKKYKIPVDQWSLVKAIGGCKSDNVKLLKGISEEGALTYLRGEAPKAKVKLVETHEAEVQFALSLVKLPFCPYQLLYKETCLDMTELISFCQKMGFRQFLNQIGEFGVFKNGPTETDEER